jgi:hypothetical protein
MRTNSMNTIHRKRPAVLVGLISAVTIGAALLLPAAAQANVPTPPAGSQPGNLTLNPSSGDLTSQPSFTTTTGCPTGNQANATLSVMADDGSEQQISAPVVGPSTPNPFTGAMNLTMGDALGVAGPAGETYEFVIDCHAVPGDHGKLVQSTFVTFAANGNWTSTGSAPSGPTATTTTVNASASTALQGSTVTLTASVTGTGAAGNVEFFDGPDSLGTVALASGSASKAVSTLPVGDDSITAKFEPTDTTAFGGSTSAPIIVTIVASGGDTGLETLNLNVPLNEGVFTMSVSSAAVALSAPVKNATFFESTGALSPVTVTDGRVQSVPGWSVSGQVGDFISGANKIVGDDLGWSPSITTPNTAGDVTPGATIAAQSTPGLKEGGALAKAGVNQGLGQTVLGAGLDLKFPLNTKVGAYTATLTVTAVESAS